AVVGPGRLPRSRSACLTQLRSVSPEQPIFAAIDWMAAHCDEYSRSCSNTSRTARSRTSGEYFFACLMTPISQELEPPANPGRFTATGSHGYSLDQADCAARHHIWCRSEDRGHRCPGTPRFAQ